MRLMSSYPFTEDDAESQNLPLPPGVSSNCDLPPA